MVRFNLRQLPRFYTPLDDKIFLAGSFNQWVPNDDRFQFDSTTQSLTVDLQDMTSIEFKLTRGSWSTTETWADGSERANRRLVVVSMKKDRDRETNCDCSPEILNRLI